MTMRTVQPALTKEDGDMALPMYKLLFMPNPHTVPSGLLVSSVSHAVARSGTLRASRLLVRAASSWLCPLEYF